MKRPELLAGQSVEASSERCEPSGQERRGDEDFRNGRARARAGASYSGILPAARLPGVIGRSTCSAFLHAAGSSHRSANEVAQDNDLPPAYCLNCNLWAARGPLGRQVRARRDTALFGPEH